MPRIPNYRPFARQPAPTLAKIYFRPSKLSMPDQKSTTKITIVNLTIGNPVSQKSVKPHKHSLRNRNVFFRFGQIIGNFISQHNAKPVIPKVCGLELDSNRLICIYWYGMTPTIDPLILAQDIVAGKSQLEIAQSLGVRQPTISRNAQRPEVKAYIDNLSDDLIQRKLSNARNNLELLIDQLPTRLQAEAITDNHGHYTNTVNYQGQVIPGDVHKQAISQGAKASIKLLESVGILPSQSPSYFFQTLVQQSNTQVVLPGIAALLSSLLGIQPTNAEVIDIDPVQALKDMDAG